MGGASLVTTSYCYLLWQFVEVMALYFLIYFVVTVNVTVAVVVCLFQCLFPLWCCCSPSTVFYQKIDQYTYSSVPIVYGKLAMRMYALFNDIFGQHTAFGWMCYKCLFHNLSISIIRNTDQFGLICKVVRLSTVEFQTEYNIFTYFDSFYLLKKRKPKFLCIYQSDKKNTI